MPTPPKTKRNLQIVTLRQRHLTYAASAARFGITRERVRAILLKEAKSTGKRLWLGASTGEGRRSRISGGGAGRGQGILGQSRGARR